MEKAKRFRFKTTRHIYSELGNIDLRRAVNVIVDADDQEKAFNLLKELLEEVLLTVKEEQLREVLK